MAFEILAQEEEMIALLDKAVALKESDYSPSLAGEDPPSGRCEVDNGDDSAVVDDNDDDGKPDTGPLSDSTPLKQLVPASSHAGPARHPSSSSSSSSSSSGSSSSSDSSLSSDDSNDGDGGHAAGDEVARAAPAVLGAPAAPEVLAAPAEVPAAPAAPPPAALAAPPPAAPAVPSVSGAAPRIHELSWTDVVCPRCNTVTGQFKYSPGPLRGVAKDPPTWVMRAKTIGGTWPVQGKFFHRRVAHLVGDSDRYCREWIHKNRNCCG